MIGKLNIITMTVACCGLAAVGVSDRRPIKAGGAQQAGGAPRREADEGNFRVKSGESLAESPALLAGVLAVGIRELIQGLLEGGTAWTVVLPYGQGKILVFPEHREREEVPGDLSGDLDALSGELEAFRVQVFFLGHDIPRELKAVRLSVAGVPDLQSMSALVRMAQQVTL